MQDQVFKLISDVLNVDLSTLTLESSIENTQGWDSIKQMQIVIAFEEEFDLVVSDEDLIEATSIRKLLALAEPT